MRSLFDVYQHKDGRLRMSMENGSTEAWKLESMEALYEETMVYGGLRPAMRNNMSVSQ